MKGVLGPGVKEPQNHCSFLKDSTPDLLGASSFRVEHCQAHLYLVLIITCYALAVDDSIKGDYQDPGGIHSSFNLNVSLYYMV